MTIAIATALTRGEEEEEEEEEEVSKRIDEGTCSFERPGSKRI